MKIPSYPCNHLFNIAAQEAVAEPEPKFNPFTGVGRRLDGKPLKSQPPPLSSSSTSKDKPPNVANGGVQSSASGSTSQSNRQSQGKLVFGSNVNRTPKENQQVLFFHFSFRVASTALPYLVRSTSTSYEYVITTFNFFPSTYTWSDSCWVRGAHVSPCVLHFSPFLT